MKAFKMIHLKKKKNLKKPNKIYILYFIIVKEKAITFKILTLTFKTAFDSKTNSLF